MKSTVVAGLVGGDLNAIDYSEHFLHKASEGDLKDVWDDCPALWFPVPKTFQKDLSYGSVRGMLGATKQAGPGSRSRGYGQVYLYRLS
jgi:hypothetical protein